MREDNEAMNKPFGFGHEEPNTNLLNLQIHLEAMLDDRLRRFGGANVRAIWFSVENNRFRWGPHAADWENAAHIFYDRMRSEPDFVRESERYVRRIGEQMQDAVTPFLLHDRGSTLADRERADLIKQLFDWNREMCVYGFVGPVMEMPHELVTRGLRELVMSKSGRFQRTADEYIVALSTPAGELPSHHAHRQLRSIAKMVAGDKILTEAFLRAQSLSDAAPEDHPAARELREHIKLFPWLIFSYRGPLWDEREAMRELKHLISLSNLDAHTRERDEKNGRAKELHNRYADELGLSEKERLFMEGVRSIAYTKLLRKDYLSLGNFAIHLLGRPVWERLGLALEDIDVYCIDEFLALITRGEVVDKTETEKRKQFVLYLQESETGYSILTGDSARQWIADSVDFGEAENESEVSGTVASLGNGSEKISGVARLVEIPADMYAFQDGDILVSSGTTPDLLPAMRRAGAIVTDTGGLTSHAAVVSRELKVACIIGTRHATRVFKNGDTLELDMKKASVKKI